MNQLLTYLNSLPPADQQAFARRANTTVGYLRKAISVNQQLGESLCINLERESGGAVVCEALRGDVDWAYIRGTSKGGVASQVSSAHAG